MSLVQKLMQITGKSADEIKALVKKASSGADEIDLGDISSPTLKKGRPAKSIPVDPNEISLDRSARKKLELGDVKSAEPDMGDLDLPETQAINPNIDDYRLPTANPITERGMQGGNLPPATIADEIPGPLAQRGSTAAQTVGPEVVGQGTSRAAKEAGNIVDAEVVPSVGKKISTLDAVKQFAKENPGKIAGGLTLAEMARQMMSGGGDVPQVPFAPHEPMKAIEPKKPEEVKAKTVNVEKPKPNGLDTDAVKKEVAADKEQVPVEEKSDLFRKILEAGIEERNQGTWEANLLRASERLGAGLSRTKAEHGSSDIRRESAKEAMKDAMARIESEQKQQGFDKIQQEMGDENAMRDPSSAISQATVEQMRRFGIKVNTAMEAKQLSPQIFNMLMAEKAQQNQREIAAMQIAANKTKTEAGLDEKQRKFAQGLRKELTTGTLGKQYATYKTGARMGDALTEFAKNPSGYTDYATLMGGLKALQGDESVVREAEVRMGINAASAIDSAYNALQRAATGRTLTDKQRQEMIGTVKILTDISKKSFLDSAAPILEQGEMEGIPQHILLGRGLSETESQEAPSDNNSRQMVKVTRIADGVTKMMPAEKAASMDTSKYTISK